MRPPYFSADEVTLFPDGTIGIHNEDDPACVAGLRGTPVPVRP